MSWIDFGRHSRDYAVHRRGFPESFYRRVEAILTLSGRRALDLATGPGTIALELAARGSEVVGLDVAAGQVAMAEELARARGLERLARFLVGRAEDTGLASSSFDLVTAGSCWHWFDEARVLLEVRRLLKSEGMLVIAHNSYLAEHSPAARDSEALILEFNPGWPMAGQPGVFPSEIDGVIRGGLELVEAFCYDHDEEFSHERWRGRMRVCNGVGSGGLPPAEVERFDQLLSELLARKYPDPLLIPHRIWCVAARLAEG